MARLKKGSLPSYRLHKPTGLAVVTLDGHDHYLGPHGTPASKQKYTSLIRAWLQRREQPDLPQQDPLVGNDRPTVNEVILAYLKHADTYYKLNHGENKEAGCIDDALKAVQECGYGREPADSFRPSDLKRVREAMIARKWSRNYINAQINRIKRMYRFAVEEDLVPGTVYHALLAVAGLRKGTPGCRETRKVKPVPVAHVKAVLAKARPMMQAMIRFAYHSGARPEEVCGLKPCYLDRSGKVWVYNVPDDANKTDVHEIERKIFIGPRAQRVLEPWLVGIGPEEYVFSPLRAEAIRQAERRANRKTPLYPSHLRAQAAKRKAIAKRPKGDHYTPISFRRAVKRLCDQARVPRWTPNRLRHNAATRFRKRYGIEVARILLGHRKMNTTEVYAEQDRCKAARAAFRLG